MEIICVSQNCDKELGQAPFSLGRVFSRLMHCNTTSTEHSLGRRLTVCLSLTPGTPLIYPWDASHHTSHLPLGRLSPTPGTPLIYPWDASHLPLGRLSPRLSPTPGTPVSTHHLYPDDWLAPFSLIKCAQSGLRHHDFYFPQCQ